MWENAGNILAGEQRDTGMRAVLGIMSKTVRASLRSHVAQVVLGALVLAVVLLPLTIADDGTAYGHVQVSLTYSLGVIGFLLSIVSLWLGCTTMADDIEGYQMHMVVSKPVSTTQIWLGKWLGILALDALLLSGAAVVVLALMFWRLHTTTFTGYEAARLANEVLVGRRVFLPLRPNVETLVEKEIQKRQQALEQGSRQPGGAGVPPLQSEMAQRAIDRSARSIVRQEVVGALTTIPAGHPRLWRFEGLPKLPPGSYLNLRYRLYMEDAKSKDQRISQGVWVVIDPETKRVAPLAEHNAKTGQFQEIPLPPQIVRPDGSAYIGYLNDDPEGKPVVAQLDDGPSLLIRVASFWGNYGRVILLLFLQLAFFAAVGCTCGAALSTPVAIFMAFTYVSVGFVIAGMDIANLQQEVMPSGFLAQLNVSLNVIWQQFQSQGGLFMKFGYLVRLATQAVTVSLGEFNEVGRLAKGELVELGRIASVALQTLLLRGLPIALFGIWILRRRELGLVVHR